MTATPKSGTLHLTNIENVSNEQYFNSAAIFQPLSFSSYGLQTAKE